MFHIIKHRPQSPMILNEFDDLENLVSQMMRSSPFPPFFRESDITFFENKDGGYKLEIPVPGFSKEEIKVEILPDNRIMVSGEKKIDEKDENGTYYHKMSSSIKRAFTLPTNADLSTTQAEVKNGVLVLQLNSRDQNTDRTLIEIK